MDCANPVWPDYKNDYKKFLAFTAYTWEAQNLLNEAERKKSPFAILRLPEEIRPFSELEFLMYKKNNIQEHK